MSDLIEYPPPGADETLKVEQISNDLFVLTLTRQNKAKLFSEGIARLDSGYEEADLIIQNLKSWSPDVAAHFHRRTSDIILDTPFRLIHSSPTGIPLDGAFAIRQYLAISYSWHKTDWPGTPHCAPDPRGPWPVGKRFATAILGLRGHPREGVWMDQICIDQDDTDQQQRAIACMDVVYNSCRRLVVLLEDVELTDDEAAACALFDVPDLRMNMGVRRDDDEIITLKSLFDKVARARWWTRAWCFHEFVVGEPWSIKRHHQAHHTVFVLGHNHKKTVNVKWPTLHSVLVTVMVELDHHTPDTAHIIPILAGLEDRTSPLLDGPLRAAGSSRSSFVARFNSASRAGCLKPGDRLSVCINILGLGLGLTYVRDEGEPGVDEVYYLSVMLALAAGELAPLAFASTDSLVLGGTRSWLMRPVTHTDTTLRKFTLGGVKGVHKVSVDRMELDLVFFNHSFENATVEEISKTYDVFPDAIKSTPPPLKGSWPSSVSRHRPDEEVEQPRRQFLAAVIAGGPGLARRLWAQLERDVVQYSYNTGMFADFRPNPDLGPSAESFMELLGTGGVDDVDGDGSDGFDVESALDFLTWITDPRSIYWISWRTLRGPCGRDGQQALMTGLTGTINFETASADENVAVAVAVPTDLLDVDCSLMRAWVLVKVDSKQEVGWRVVAKCLLLGTTDLAEEVSRTENNRQIGAAVELKRRQVVLG